MLKPLYKQRHWVSHRTYDLEWDPYTLQVRLAGVYNGDRYWWYKSVEEMLECQLVPETSGKTFYAHNAGRADFTFLLMHLRNSPKNYHVDISFSGSSANIVKIARGRHKWNFVDSLWLFRTSLKKIGDEIGLPKTGPSDEALLGPDADERIKRWYATAPLSELIPYNHRDCEILWHAIHQFQTEVWELGGELKKTIASTGLNILRRSYLTRIIPTIKSVNEIARQSYAASRVEVLRQHMGRGFYYDINSSFPASMTLPQPGAVKRIHWGKLPESLSNETPLLLSRCVVEVPDLEIPPLALRAHGKVYFPTGTWRGWFTGMDLKALVERGGKILKCYKTYEFEPWEDLANYVHEIYSRRKKAKAEGRDFASTIYKFLGNALYGKFAETRHKMSMLVNPTREQVEHYGLRHPESSEEADACKARMWKLGIYLVPREIEIPHEHVPVASHVTSCSRLLLLQHLERASLLGGSAYYCDTDGFASDVQYETSPDLGQLKLEATIESGDFYCPKVYRFAKSDGNTIYKAKGFSLPHKNPEKCAKQFSELVGDVTDHAPSIAIERLSCITEMLKHGGVLTPYHVRLTKHLLLKNPKRHYYNDGTSRPWRVSEVAPERAISVGGR